jgi:hypothetical protein
MSLLTDKFFYSALTQSEDVTAIVDDRIFNPARTTVDEDEDKIPYIIITFEGLQNNADTKDDGVEGDEDRVTVNILCVHEDCDALGDMTELVRQTLCDYWDTHRCDPLTPITWQFSASRVEYDPDKPCCYQTLIYQCDTNK